MEESLRENDSCPSDISVAVPVRHCVDILRLKLDGLDKRSGLVIGCGSGDEVAYLRQALRNPTIVGLDIEPNFSLLARAGADLLISDAKQLPFRGEVFDFVAAFHSLEHVGNPYQALAEIKRVLKPAGWLYVGVPNKARLLGYIGSFNATLREKIVWNMQDYRARLRGKFENELGAHAGFESKELVGLLDGYFNDTQLLTEEYFRLKYGGRIPGLVLNFLLSRYVINYSVPAHYALCQKEQ